MNLDPSILLAARVLGTLVFAAAVLGKLRHREEFIGVVANYRLLPEALVAPVAWLVIFLEAFVVVSLASGILLITGVTLALALLCGFAVAMTINLARGRTEIDCGCFQSALRQRLSVALVVRNLLLIAIMLPVLEQAARSPTLLPAFGAQAQSLLQVMDGIGAGVVLFVLYQVFGQVLSLRDAAEALRKRFA